MDFVKTQIGVTVGNPEKRSDKKYYHTVRCNATRQNPKGITYNNVLSVGNSPLPANCVVFLVAPNAQFSNQFILGQLDDTPVNITAGSIALGDDDPNLAPIYLTGTIQSDGSYGHIANFKIFPTKLQFTGDNSAISFIQGTAFRISEFNSGKNVTLIMDGDNARFAINTEGYSDGGLYVSNAQGWDDDGNFYDPKSGNNYVYVSPSALTLKSSGTTYTIGEQSFKFLAQSQDAYGDLGNLRISVAQSGISFTNVSNNKSVYIAFDS